MNAIALLQADHRYVEDIFRRLEDLSVDDSSSAEKRELCRDLVRELSILTAIEEMIFYPAVKRSVGEAKELLLESIEHNDVIKWELDALGSMKIPDERFNAKIRVVKDFVMHHVQHEQDELFPMVEQAFGVAQLEKLGDKLQAAKVAASMGSRPRARLGGKRKPAKGPHARQHSTHS